MNEEFRTGLISRLASLSPQDFQSVISAATGRRIRTNSRPIPKKLYSKMMTRAKALKRIKKVKIPFKIEGHFEAKIGMYDDTNNCGTLGVDIHIKPDSFTTDYGIQHALQDSFWEVDESESSIMEVYHKALAERQETMDELREMVEEACSSYGHDSYDFLDKLLHEAEQELDK